MLSCGCEFDPSDEPGAWWYYVPYAFSKFNKSRRKRCRSCNELIDIGSNCLEFQRERNPWTDIEQQIKGDEICMSSLFMCEACGEIYLNLTDIGYCVEINSNMQKCLDEYHKLTGFKKVVAV